MLTDDSPTEAQILWDIEGRHLDEAEFLVESRTHALDAPTYTLEELSSGPEQRLYAHIDALALAGPVVAQRLLEANLRDVNAYPERVAAATLACASVDAALETLMSASEEEHIRGLVHGLELREDEALDAKLLERLHSAPLGPRRVALLKALARRRVPISPWPGLDSDDSRGPLARLARWSPDPRALDDLRVLARDEDPFVRADALESALLRGVDGAWESLIFWAFTRRESPARRQALVWVAMLGDEVARRRVLGLLDDPAHRADVVWASSFGGSIEAVRRCLPLLEDEELGPLAAELVCAVVGLSRTDDRFWLVRAADDATRALPPLAGDELDADLSLTPEALLPLPNPEAIRAWWFAREDQFEPGTRYLRGRPSTATTLLDALHDAPLRRRHELARELAARSGGALDLPTRARVCIQRRRLSQLCAHPKFASVEAQRGRPSA